MRPPLLALGAAGALAIFLTGCGGGGGSHAAIPAPVASTPATDPNPNMEVNNTHGPTGTMTITLKLPSTKTAGAALKAQVKQFGPKHANARIRSLANTSPSASIRAMGQQRNTYAKQVQERTGRSPQFVDGSTNEIELVVSDSSNDNLMDETLTCSLSAGQCSATFDVPVGSNLTVSALTYDDCEYLLAAGSISGLTLTTGVNAQQTITLNGVVAYFGVTVNASPFAADVAGSQAQPSFTVSSIPLDADNNIITAPGTLIDENYLPIQSLNVIAYGIDNASFAEQYPATYPTQNITPTNGQTATVTGATVADATFAYSGTGFDANEQFQISENATGTAVLPAVFIYGPYGCCSVPPAGPYATNPPVGILTQAVTPAIAWSYGGGASNNPQFTGMTSFGLWIAEFPTATGQTSVGFAVTSNLPSYAGNITLTDDGEPACTDFSSNPPEGPNGPYAGSPLAYSLTFTPAGNETCQYIATDDSGNQANVEFAIDSTNVTVQRKARKH